MGKKAFNRIKRALEEALWNVRMSKWDYPTMEPMMAKGTKPKKMPTRKPSKAPAAGTMPAPAKPMKTGKKGKVAC